jgi:hypothetical protein
VRDGVGQRVGSEEDELGALQTETLAILMADREVLVAKALANVTRQDRKARQRDR